MVGRDGGSWESRGRTNGPAPGLHHRLFVHLSQGPRCHGGLDGTGTPATGQRRQRSTELGRRASSAGMSSARTGTPTSRPGSTFHGTIPDGRSLDRPLLDRLPVQVREQGPFEERPVLVCRRRQHKSRSDVRPSELGLPVSIGGSPSRRVRVARVRQRRAAAHSGRALVQALGLHPPIEGLRRHRPVLPGRPAHHRADPGSHRTSQYDLQLLAGRPGLAATNYSDGLSPSPAPIYIDDVRIGR
jgi:hypothetical protein